MKRQKPEQIVTLLHQVDAALDQGKTIEDIRREHGIGPATYHRWKKKYGGVSIEDVENLKELELENAKFEPSKQNVNLNPV